MLKLQRVALTRLPDITFHWKKALSVLTMTHPSIAMCPICSLGAQHSVATIIPSHRAPVGLYVLASSTSGQWNATIKAPMADCSVAWNETFIVHWCPPKSSSTSTVLHFEIYVEFGQTLGRGQLVRTVKTTLEELLEDDGQYPYLLLRTRRVETPQLTGSTADSLEVHRRPYVGRARLVVSLMHTRHTLSTRRRTIGTISIVLFKAFRIKHCEEALRSLFFGHLYCSFCSVSLQEAYIDHGLL
ncbi:hypothetical protein BDR03DRAFT_957166 [Suillus americanus]|nr:hypothetical protein BDR03DRAFT_957166 [Suillus americanus]